MTQTPFEERVARIQGRHRRLSDGVAYSVDPDGLITARPARHRAIHLSVRGAFALLVFIFAFKVALFILSGEAAYLERLAYLAEGSTLQRTVAWLMHPDIATRATVSALEDLTRMVGSALG